MPKIKVLNMKGEELREIELAEELFAQAISEAAVHQAVVNHLANRRQGTQSTKTRSEVRGGGRKPWKQKGRGSARQGSIRSPQWKGGGVVFAPKPRDYSYSLPKKVRRLAMKSALTSKVLGNEMIVLDELKLDAPKTKDIVNVFKNVNAAKKTLVVTADNDVNVVKSVRNIEGANVCHVSTLNVYDILNCDSFIITTDAVKKVEEVYA